MDPEEKEMKNDYDSEKGTEAKENKKSGGIFLIENWLDSGDVIGAFIFKYQPKILTSDRD